MIRINSKRKYTVVSSTENDMIIDLETIIQPHEHSLEIVFALEARLDQILDLQIHDHMPFQPNRDDSTTKGVIVRIS